MAIKIALATLSGCGSLPKDDVQTARMTPLREESLEGEENIESAGGRQAPLIDEKKMGAVRLELTGATLMVPSVIVPEECHALINPAHADPR